MHNVFNVSLLYPYLPGGTQYGTPDPIISGNNQEHEIKNVIAHMRSRVRAFK